MKNFIKNFLRLSGKSYNFKIYDFRVAGALCKFSVSPTLPIVIISNHQVLQRLITAHWKHVYRIQGQRGSSFSRAEQGNVETIPDQDLGPSRAWRSIQWSQCYEGERYFYYLSHPKISFYHPSLCIWCRHQWPIF